MHAAYVEMTAPEKGTCEGVDVLLCERKAEIKDAPPKPMRRHMAWLSMLL